MVVTIYVEYVAICVGLIALFDVVLISVSVFFIKLCMYRKMYSNFVRDVQIEFKGKTYECKGFIDTGNRLCDPNTETPVVMISRALYLKMCPVLDGHYVNFSTIGSGGRLWVFRPQSFLINNRRQNVLLAVSNRRFRDYVKYDVLLQNFA